MTAFDIVFPVFGGRMGENVFKVHEIYGTAFYIGNNFYVTCGHTVENASVHEAIAIGYNHGDQLNYAYVTASEVFKKNDSGILQAEIPKISPYKWKKDKLMMLNDVISVGFPYGFDRENFKILVRSFKGHISMAGHHNYNFYKSPYYELSYQIPKGLSGAPLLFNDNGLKICGITIGNEITEMIVNTFKEKNEENDSLVIYEKTEALHRGIAMQVQSFFEIKSELLSSTFFEYLTSQKLLI